ncbi:hypothetical protein ACOSQ2_028016 [Xanthoceras sorbifolium]
METTSRYCRTSVIFKYFLLLCFAIAAVFITHSDARKPRGLIMRDQNQPRSKSMIMKALEDLKMITHINGDDQTSNTGGPYGVNSPLTMPPFDSLAPIPLPENTPPYCLYPPFTPQTPSTTIPSPTTTFTPPSPSSSYISPIIPFLNPPLSPIATVPSPPGSIPTPNTPPETVPGPPESIPSPDITIPSPSGPVLTPPYYEPSPPSFVPSPPSSVPSPTGFVPSPPVFLPPTVYPPPILGPPSPRRGPSMALWCVAKPSVPDPIIQEAMNYACGSGADCDTIQPSGPCFEPDTVYAHASYAFNSYWQRTKVAGGTCSFGGTAMLVTIDPSHNGCHFMYA